MNEIPQSPEEFITRWLPERFAEARGLFGDKSSSGSIAFELLDSMQSWSLSIQAGKLTVTPGIAGDLVVRICTTSAAFAGLLAGVPDRSSELQSSPQLNIIKNLALDAEKAKLVKNLPGSLAFEVKEASQLLRVVIIPGTCSPTAAPSCTLRIDAADFAELKAGATQPFQLLMQGKIAIEGDAQIAMMLGTSLM